MNNRGELYGIGVGPGDPELLTIKAFKLLKNSDVIIAPKSSPKKSSLALDVVKRAFIEWGASLPKVDNITFPMTTVQNKKKINKEIEDKILNNLNHGLNLSFITLGDPFLYSTYRRLTSKIAEYKNIKVKHIPGIYSFSAISARLGKELTWGNDRLAIIPVEKNKNYLQELKNFETVVFLKVTSDLHGLINQLKEAKRLQDAILVEKVGMEDEKIYYELDKLDNINYLSTIIVFKNQTMSR
ncbi:precorrin-2 C(20)-methyltransferase [Natranaerobius trueperi]|uniref:Precorrin-2 C(20)-methyltransferase n=1 Tax=Natranaerobius trueperi TaxID=759412 RepID=A0A226BVF0_9FIRM|nr:precorrin-2 C(20)-methyltransferase [Natranaerobius trueperi]OWZ82976.1 precorrin-2 C(20)-methyltransferase [Natranaerobius trueperi]